MKDLKYYLKKAAGGDFAIGAINMFNLESFQALAQASANCNSPVIAAVSEKSLCYMQDYVVTLATQAKKTNPALFLHLDHGTTFEICKKAIDLGFDSVMIDASDKCFEENVKLTKEIVKYAHDQNVLVEAELGTLAGIEDEVSSNKTIYTDPLQAKEFVKQTKVDTLAIAIGTSHGAYKFSGESKLNLEILEQIENLVPKTPLVLHGASSVPQNYVKLLNKFGGKLKGAKGVDEKLLYDVCHKHNICKINSDTDLRIAFTMAVRKHLKENPSEIDLRKYLGAGKNQVIELLEQKINLYN